MPLIVVLVAWPLIEIALFVQIGGAIGLWPTLAIVIGSAMLGMWLMRRQGGAALADVQRHVAELRDPTAPMAKGAFVMLAGALLILPGFLTDALGLLLLVPGVQSAITGAAGRRLAARGRGGFPRQGATHRYGRGTVIDAEYEYHTDPAQSGTTTGPAVEPAPGSPSSPGGRATQPTSGWTRDAGLR